MHNTLMEWTSFFIRWMHLIAGISWIGNSFYFMWMDTSFVSDELYMVHGGHFYHVEKQKIRPDFIPKTIHWFKWEATLTWFTGFILLIFVYYLTNGIYLIGPGSFIQNPQYAMAASLAIIFGSWFLYDFFWQSKFAEKNKTLATAISLGMVVALCWALCQLFSGRGAYIHLGAIFATLMVLNVWIRILPGQTAMLHEARAGKTPNYESGTKAKWRSTHNSYMTLPVLFAMLSNHFPLAYGHAAHWVLLVLLCVLGGVIRHMMLQWNKGKTGVALLVPIAAIIVILIFITTPKNNQLSYALEKPTFSQVKNIMTQRCLSCHSQHPVDPLFSTAPNGVMFDNAAEIQKFAARIRERVWVTKTMPLANRTQITEEERAILGHWVESGAAIDE